MRLHRLHIQLRDANEDDTSEFQQHDLKRLLCYTPESFSYTLRERYHLRYLHHQCEDHEYVNLLQFDRM